VVPEGLGIRIGLAVSDAIERAVPRIPPLRLKWPNDLYLHQRKAGGILCEARWDGDRLAWIVAGIGINVRNPIPDDLRPTATSLGEFDPDLTPESLAQPVATAVAEASARPGPLTPAELEQFAAKDWLRGRRLATPVAGYAAGIAPDGTLLVGTTEGTVRVPVAESVGLECRGD
jgi:BirA family biotin operon repressor/biotin-[acetyl-CoA-carboxylase] ligase